MNVGKTVGRVEQVGVLVEMDTVGEFFSVRGHRLEFPLF